MPAPQAYDAPRKRPAREGGRHVRGPNRAGSRHARWAAPPLMLAMAGGAVACGGGTKTDKLSISDGTVNGKAGFDPASLSTKKGHKVEITVTNTGDKTHGFSINEFGVAKTVDQGQKITVDSK